MGSTILVLILGLLLGIVIAVLILVRIMRSSMLLEKRSRFDFDQTVKTIQESAVAKGWSVSSVLELDKSIVKHGGKAVPRVTLVNICQPHHASTILGDDRTRLLSVMMPCTISVYHKSDDNTYVGFMNASLLGKMWGGIVSSVMGGAVSKEQQSFIASVTKELAQATAG